MQLTASALLILFTWVLSRVLSIPIDPHRQVALIDNFIQEIMKCRHVPGLALSVVQNNKKNNRVFTRGYGVTDLKTKKSVTPKTIFCLGSLTKAFTATLLTEILVNNDRFSLDTPIRQILGPSFRMADKLRTDHSTIRDILAHRLGIPSYFTGLLMGFNITRSELIRRLRYFTAVKEFRSSYLYNNYMYALAGYIAENLTGHRWEELMREMLFKPLNMTTSFFAEDITDWENFALPYVAVNDELRPLDPNLIQHVVPAGPAGSVCSSADDMVQWMLLQLNRGHHHTFHHIISEETFEEIHSPQNVIPLNKNHGVVFPFKKTFPVSDLRYSYNLGWNTGSYRGYTKIYHGGRINGYDSLLWILPDLHTGIFTTCNGPMNTNSLAAEQLIHQFLSDIIMGEEPWLNTTTACTYPAPWMQPPTPVPEHNYPARLWRSLRSAKEYIGSYEHPALGTAIVFYNVSADSLQVNRGKFGTALLLPLPNLDTFIMKFFGILWFLSEADEWHEGVNFTVYFRSSMNNGIIDELEIPFEEMSAPPIFRKGNSDLEIEFDDICHSNFQKRISYNIIFIMTLALWIRLVL